MTQVSESPKDIQFYFPLTTMLYHSSAMSDYPIAAIAKIAKAAAILVGICFDCLAFPITAYRVYSYCQLTCKDTYIPYESEYEKTKDEELKKWHETSNNNRIRNQEDREITLKLIEDSKRRFPSP